jgi:hypothetical protein
VIRFRCGVILVVLTISLLLAGGASSLRAATADSLRTATESPRVATIMFLSYQITGRPPADLGALQSACWDRLESAVGELGHANVLREDLGKPMLQWKVRNGLGVSQGFLDDLASRLGVADLLVCDLAVYDDGLFLAGRDVVTATGEVSWADIEELRMSRQAAGEDAALGALVEETEIALRRMLSRWESRSGLDGQVGGVCLLPVRSDGLTLLARRVMQSCLLSSLLHAGWRVEDPGVTFSRLRDMGIDPEFLDEKTRPVLIASGVHDGLLVCNLVAWESAASSRTTAFATPGEVTGPQALVPSALLSIRLVDLESGTVIFAGSEFVSAEPSYGLFGVQTDRSPGRRMLSAAERLVHAAGRKG